VEKSIEQLGTASGRNVGRDLAGGKERLGLSHLTGAHPFVPTQAPFKTMKVERKKRFH
jgi:hypothetical protein